MSLFAAVIVSTLVGAHPADFGTPTTAYAGTPVRVQACQLYVSSGGGSSEGGMIGGDVRTLQISFVNQAAATATSVRFAIRSGARTETIVDAGTFSTGILIAHNFVLDGLGASDARCSVDFVAFADGSNWTQR